MELRHLKYFLAVAETQNIRLAAQKVHVTQPAISRKIKELESELGVQLFDRLPKGLSLNRAGKVYQKQLGAIIHQIEDANAKVRQFAQTEYGTLALGSPDFVLLEGPAAQALQQFRRANNNIDLEVFSDTPMVLLKRLELEQVDGVFGYFMPPLDDEYAVEVVAQDKLVLAFPASWRDRLSKTMTIEALNQFPAVRLTKSADPHYFEWQDALFHDLGWTPKSTQWAHGESTVLGLVAAESGVAIVNERHLLRHTNSIDCIALDLLPNDVTLNFIYKQHSDNPALNLFLKCLSQQVC